MTIFPSLTMQETKKVQQELVEFSPYADGFHLDIMDGEFVKNKMGSIELINTIRKTTKLPFWVHLMVKNPADFIDKLSLYSSDYVTFHLEAALDNQIVDPKTLIHLIHKKNMLSGVAINPETPVSTLAPYLSLVNQVVIMSVKPGASGQPFIPETASKLKQLHNLRSQKKTSLTLAVDGGVTFIRLPMLNLYGVNQVAIGSAITATPDPVDTLQKFALEVQTLQIHK